MYQSAQWLGWMMLVWRQNKNVFQQNLLFSLCNKLWTVQTKCLKIKIKLEMGMKQIKEKEKASEKNETNVVKIKAKKEKQL